MVITQKIQRSCILYTYIQPYVYVRVIQPLKTLNCYFHLEQTFCADAIDPTYIVGSGKYAKPLTKCSDDIITMNLNYYRYVKSDRK